MNATRRSTSQARDQTTADVWRKFVFNFQENYKKTNIWRGKLFQNSKSVYSTSATEQNHSLAVVFPPVRWWDTDLKTVNFVDAQSFLYLFSTSVNNTQAVQGGSEASTGLYMVSLHLETEHNLI